MVLWVHAHNNLLALLFEPRADPGEHAIVGLQRDPLCWFMTGTPTDTKPEKRSTPTRTPGER